VERENPSAGGLSQTKNGCGETTKSLTQLWKARLLGETLLKTWKQRHRERETDRQTAKKNGTGTFFLKRLSIFFCEGLDFVCDDLEFLGL
jgi:hypothetical protein